MKKTRNQCLGRIWLWLLLFVSSQIYAQLTIKEGTKNKTVATQEWVKEYVKSQLKQTRDKPPVVDNRPNCSVGLTLLTVTPSKTQLEFTFHSVDVQSIDYNIKSGNVTLISGNTGKLTSSRVYIPHSLPAGNYTLQIKATNCKSDSTTGVKPFTLVSTTPPQPPVVDNRPNCAVGLTLLTVTPSKTQLEFTFHSVDVQSIDYNIKSGNVTLISGNTGKLTSSRVFIPHSLPAGNYTLQIRATNCKSDSTTGVKPFTLASTIVPPVIPTNPDRTGTGNIKLTPLKDPLLPAIELTGDYEIRYIESRPNNDADLEISVKDGQIYLTDVGNSLQSVSYTLNGWTDLENCGKLENEPIRPYRRYELAKYSVARPTIKETWMAEWATPKADLKRSELFFYVVPTQETWNPVGDSPNPIGRPAVFSRLPKFKLKNRTYGFEYDILDETDQRKEELSISFNWKEQHQKLYSPVLSEYLRSLPPKPDGTFRAFHELTKQECIEFANRLQIQKIMAFDIEPDENSQWIIDYDAPNFTTNMGYVLQRLEERGAKAYNWMEVPGRSVKNLTLDKTVLGPHAGYGHQHQDIAKYKEAYSRIGDLKKRENAGSIISTGFGYVGFDNNFSATDGNGQNISPQVTYLKALDASELWSRAMPDKQQVYFAWAFSEFDFYRFPNNHVVEIPEYNARAIRTDNKPLYPPDYFQDNLTLSFLTSKYLFYWCPGPLGWNPANTTTNSYQHAKVDKDGKREFSVWSIEKGNPPLQQKFYAGKEAMAINATVNAAYIFSQIQDAADGTRTGPRFRYGRATKDGQVLSMINVDAITDGSWYIDALIKRQPFAVYLQNGDNKVLLVQDVWSRPGRFTDFEVEIDGKIYAGQTEGNRLFVAKL